MKQILYSTTNPAKVAHMRELLQPLPLEILSLQELGLTRQVEEDGNTPAENAEKKVRFFFTEVGLPTMAIDTGLNIHRLPKEKQPGLLVRRICGREGVITDEEMLKYYAAELEKVGGQSQGTWETAVALMTGGNEIFCDTFTSETMFTVQVSPVRTVGEPLNSLQYDVVSGKYYSEMSAAERIRVQGARASGIFEFVSQYLGKL